MRKPDMNDWDNSKVSMTRLEEFDNKKEKSNMKEINKYNTKSGKRVSMPENEFKRLKLEFDVVDIAFLVVSFVVGLGIGLLV